jgi:hypothetical protein
LNTGRKLFFNEFWAPQHGLLFRSPGTSSEIEYLIINKKFERIELFQ